MKNRMDVLRDLLFELDGICRANDLKYTLVGDAAQSIYENREFPAAYDYISVAMTEGDAERLIEIVNSKNTNRSVEYFLNNPLAKSIQYRFCNNDTTLINVKEIGSHVNFGFYIKIMPIKDMTTSGFKGKLLRLFKAAWKGSAKTLSSCNGKRIIPVIILKGAVNLIGRRRAAKWLYKYNSKLRRIDKWEDIAACGKVGIGKKIFNSETVWIPETINVGNNKVFIAEAVVGSNIDRNYSHATVVMNDIENAEIPFSEIINGSDFNILLNTKKIRDDYLSTVTRANKAAKYIGHAWRIYLMTRDVVYLKELYDDELISHIKRTIDDRDYEQYRENMRPYLAARKKWKRLKVPFLKSERLEKIIDRAKESFSDI